MSYLKHKPAPRVLQNQLVIYLISHPYSSIQWVGQESMPLPPVRSGLSGPLLATGNKVMVLNQKMKQLWCMEGGGTRRKIFPINHLNS